MEDDLLDLCEKHSDYWRCIREGDEAFRAHDTASAVRQQRRSLDLYAEYKKMREDFLRKYGKT